MAEEPLRLSLRAALLGRSPYYSLAIAEWVAPGELFGYPHFTTRASLKRTGAEAGLVLDEQSGYWFGYFARLTPNG